MTSLVGLRSDCREPLLVTDDYPSEYHFREMLSCLPLRGLEEMSKTALVPLYHCGLFTMGMVDILFFGEPSISLSLYIR
jgi:hypothetical protein